MVPWLQQVMRYLTPRWGCGNILCDFVCCDVDLRLWWLCRHDSTLPSSILCFELVQLIGSFRLIADLRLMPCCPQPQTITLLALWYQIFPLCGICSWAQWWFDLAHFRLIHFSGYFGEIGLRAKRQLCLLAKQLTCRIQWTDLGTGRYVS